MNSVKKLAVIAIAAMAISGISSCAKCYVCTDKDENGEKWKQKVCSTDSEFKDNVDEAVASYEASGAKCHTSNEAI